MPPNGPSSQVIPLDLLKFTPHPLPPYSSMFSVSHRVLLALIAFHLRPFTNGTQASITWSETTNHASNRFTCKPPLVSSSFCFLFCVPARILERSHDSWFWPQLNHVIFLYVFVGRKILQLDAIGSFLCDRKQKRNVTRILILSHVDLDSQYALGGV